MLFDDTYYTIDQAAEGLYKEKGSRFISLAFPVQCEEDAKKCLEEVRNKYYDARHHCYAWAIGPGKESQRANDDGEPSGTAGKPILGQILSKDLTNIIVIVVRYFGGVKLGVSGLIRAYKTAAADALLNAVIMSKVLYDHYEIVFDYAQMNEVMRLLKDENIEPHEFFHFDRCKIIIAIRKKNSNIVFSKFKLVKNLKIKYITNV